MFGFWVIWGQIGPFVLTEQCSENPLPDLGSIWDWFYMKERPRKPACIFWQVHIFNTLGNTAHTIFTLIPYIKAGKQKRHFSFWIDRGRSVRSGLRPKCRFWAEMPFSYGKRLRWSQIWSQISDWSQNGRDLDQITNIRSDQKFVKWFISVTLRPMLAKFVSRG